MSIYIQQIRSISLTGKYINWYCQIVQRAQQRASTKKDAENICKSKIEKHHIVPQSFNIGGNKDALNYAFLTPREHFICHWLLSKFSIGSNKSKMVFTLHIMLNGNKFRKGYHTKITSRVYDKIKQNYSQLCSEVMKGKPKEKVTCPHCGKIGGKSNMTRYHFDNCGKPSERKGKPGTKRPNAPPLSDKHKINIGNANKGRKFPKVVCPQCGILGAGSNMKRYHFENCRN